mmetsp:Transcript_44484/g.72426  ORF Transcript_44484/g.72426 Transcript_44484/m.72426 type:complete len:229 (+) Transcript_44484:180-866(+)
MEQMPDGILARVFVMHNVVQLLQLRSVCKSWRRVIDSESLPWEKIAFPWSKRVGAINKTPFRLFYLSCVCVSSSLAQTIQWKLSNMLKYYEQAADCGNVQAQIELASFLYEGSNGVPKDVERAFMYITRAASGPSAHAKFLLASWLLEESPKQAILAGVWMRRAAEEGSCSAQVGLANMYDSGVGVEQNFEMAAKWMLHAHTGDTSESYSPCAAFHQDCCINTKRRIL